MTNPPEQKQVTITLTENEARAVVALLDLAVKTAGLQVAATAVAFHQRLELAFANKEEKCLT